MTMPNERTRALLFAYELLKDLQYPAKTPDVPDDVRDRARHVLRHYPDQSVIELIAHQETHGVLIQPMLDEETVRKFST
jgi:hypothetical protein